MSGVNKVILLGHLGMAPEVRTFQDGERICTFRMATNRSWRDRQSGERREHTEWHSIVLRGDGVIDVARNHLRKGSKVFLEGQLRTRKWQTQDGQDRYATEVVVGGFKGRLVLLGPAPERDGGQDGGAIGGTARDTAPPEDGAPPPARDLDDEIPF